MDDIFLFETPENFGDGLPAGAGIGADFFLREIVPDEPFVPDALPLCLNEFFEEIHDAVSGLLCGKGENALFGAGDLAGNSVEPGFAKVKIFAKKKSEVIGPKDQHFHRRNNRAGIFRADIFAKEGMFAKRFAFEYHAANESFAFVVENFGFYTAGQEKKDLIGDIAGLVKDGFIGEGFLYGSCFEPIGLFGRKGLKERNSLTEKIHVSMVYG